MSVWEGLSPPYNTIVVDPPWPMPETGKRSPGKKSGRYLTSSGRVGDAGWWGRGTGRTVKVPYATLSLAAIKALPVEALAGADAHLYLWTTNRFLEGSYGVARAWGFKPSQMLVWAKPPMGVGFGGAFTTTTEFVLFARRGRLPASGRQDSSWWAWSRPYANGHIRHSAKPPAFLDMVEAVSPAPRVELFARDQRLGWDSWGYGYEVSK